MVDLVLVYQGYCIMGMCSLQTLYLKVHAHLMVMRFRLLDGTPGWCLVS